MNTRGNEGNEEKQRKNVIKKKKIVPQDGASKFKFVPDDDLGCCLLCCAELCYSCMVMCKVYYAVCVLI